MSSSTKEGLSGKANIRLLNKEVGQEVGKEVVEEESNTKYDLGMCQYCCEKNAVCFLRGERSCWDCTGFD